MRTNNHKIVDFSTEITKEFGEKGTPERKKFDDEAYTYYTSQIIAEARHEAGMTQAELAEKVYSSKSYISQLEHGRIIPSAGLFFQIMSALGIEVLFRKHKSSFVS